MNFDFNSIFSIVGSALAVTLFGAVRGYVKGINDKLVAAEIRDAANKEIIGNQSRQLADIWEKFSQIERHLENTDNIVSRLEERSRPNTNSRK